MCVAVLSPVLRHKRHVQVKTLTLPQRGHRSILVRGHLTVITKQRTSVDCRLLLHLSLKLSLTERPTSQPRENSPADRPPCPSEEGPHGTHSLAMAIVRHDLLEVEGLTPSNGLPVHLHRRRHLSRRGVKGRRWSIG